MKIDYFDLPSSPAQNSPVGQLMLRIIADDPSLSFEEARKLANEQFVKAAGRKRFRVNTPAQEEAEALRVAKKRPRVNPVPETAKSGVSSASSTEFEP